MSEKLEYGSVSYAPEEPEKKHEKTFRKGMKKIRRRWIASLIVVIILVPFVLLGIAQVTGDGLCYDNPEREAAYTVFVEQRAYESGLQVAPKE